MSANRVHAVMAAGIDDPRLLAQWRREPALLRAYGVDPEDLDLNALWKFAGLTAKVRHNGLREDLPLTFRLLNVAGLEIEVFSSYASYIASQGGHYADSVEARAEALLSFLEQWLDFKQHAHALLWDLMRHETALSRLSRSAAAAQAFPAAESGPARASSKPRIRGEIILQEFSFDPRLLGAILQEKIPRLETAERGTFHFCYWRGKAAVEIYILPLDALTFYLLSLADGERTAAELVRIMGGGARLQKGVLRALSDLATIGMLNFAPASGLDS
jgi:hypothetical protein